jgi:hypothetical protein
VSDAKSGSANGVSANGAAAAPESRLPVFYRRPRPLNAALDAGHSLKSAGSYGFARGTNSVVVNTIEFPFAMRCYPIVFTTSAPRAAVAVLGLVDGENLFLSEVGAWTADCYVPAYVRRYPFILMEQPGSSELLLCIDDASGLVGAGEERPLFADGKPTPLVQDALKFCSEFQAQHKATVEFVGALAEHQLLAPNEARITMNSGQLLTLRGFDIIDEAKFNALPDDVFLDWRRRGWLHLAYCHFMSMANWGRLVDMHAKRPASGGA